MRAVRFHEHGDTDVLGVESIDRPDPGAEEVLIEVEAASVNPVDTYFRAGSYEPGGLPWIPGSDVAGTVVETGPDVGAFAAGDRVFGTGLGGNRPGTCAEFVTAPTDLLATLPDGVAFETGAALALVGTTAWQALIAACGLDPADRALVHGGNGGVGHAAVQLADAAGARVTTTAAPEYHDRLWEFGADDVIDYDHDDLAAAIEDAGAPDVVLDHRLDDYLSLDAAVAAHGGAIAAIGNEAPGAAFEDVPRCRGKALTVHHVSMFNTPDIGAVLDRLARLLVDGDLDAAVAHRYDLGELPAAHRAVVADSYLGKLVVEP